MRKQTLKPGDRILLGNGVILKCFRSRGGDSRLGFVHTDGSPVQVIELPPEQDDEDEPAVAISEAKK